MALAAVSMAGRCLSGLRREPVGVVVGTGVDGAVRGLVYLSGSCAGAGAMGAVGNAEDTRGCVLGVATA